ncbi:MAG: hypothetical protein DI598_02980 [Pseudopedobacter saltans]|uniref:DUF4251 domain-containing protein n=1 Tax=Pseudopedobacter saltans TaxID=151895 RepID=A0A2W5F7X5_9SPHI|nr:MAG: hypothetical protein DI598_02980 [Pseudopedobacter saltans]
MTILNMKSLPITLLSTIALSILLFTSCNSAKTAQRTKDNRDSISSWWESKQFTFHAITAQPMTGNVIQLTSEYTFDMRNDSIIAWLPYFGRGFVSPTNPGDGGIKFATKNYAIKNEKQAKKMFKMTIVPKGLPPFQNTKDVQQLFLSFGIDGYGTLQIQSLNQTPISFYGYLSSSKTN